MVGVGIGISALTIISIGCKYLSDRGKKEKIAELQEAIQVLEKELGRLKDIKSYCKRVKVNTGTGEESITNKLEKAENAFRNGGHVLDDKILCQEEFASCKSKLSDLHECIQELYTTIDTTIDAIEDEIEKLQEKIDEID